MRKHILTLGLLILTSTTALGASYKVSADCIARLSKGENRFKVELPAKALKRVASAMASKSLSLQEDPVALIVDYTKGSQDKRAYMVDFKACDVLSEDYVAHGGAYILKGKTYIDGDRNNDGIMESCRNRHGGTKNMTRPGLYITRGCHQSAKTWSTIHANCEGIKLWGLDKTNKDAYNAGVVLHELKELKQDSSIKAMGQGCPAFATGRLKKLTRYGLVNETLVYLHVPQCG